MQKINIFASYHIAPFNPGVKHGESEASGLFAPTTPPKGFLHITPIGVFRHKKIIFFLQ